MRRLATPRARRCAARAHSGLVGLVATVVARRVVPAMEHVLRFRQVFDASGQHMLQQRTRLVGGSGQRPFGAAATAKDFDGNTGASHTSLA
ncbi:MAG: hypothetical protein WBQ26_03265 [Gemmatimonadaceae bacterium]